MPGGQVYDLVIRLTLNVLLPVLFQPDVMQYAIWWLFYMIQQVFIQSDVLEVADDMRLWFDSKANVLKHIDKLASY